MRKLIHYSLALALLASTGLHAQDNGQHKSIAGNWQGSMQTSPPQRIILKISARYAGWKATLFFVDQPGQPPPSIPVALQGTNLSFLSELTEIAYTGILSADGISASTAKPR